MNSKTLKTRAVGALQNAVYDPRKLFFWYGAISLGLELLVALLDAVLAGSIDQTGGLAGMQSRAILTTAQSGLQMISAIAQPFLQFGLVFGCLQLIRGERADAQVLTAGFRRFGPVVRLLFTKTLVLTGVLIACSYVSSFVFMMTPLSQNFTQLLTPILETGDTAAVEAFLYDEASLMQLLPAMGGFFLILLTLACVVGIPLCYRMSMTDFVIMDQERMGGFRAIRESFRLTKGSCLQLFRLDLSFWWFYGLSILAVMVLSLDGLLSLAGVALPVSAQVAYWVCYGLYIVMQMGLLTLAAPKVRTTYAAAYEQLKAKQ